MTNSGRGRRAPPLRKEKRFQRDLSLDVDVRRFEVGEPDEGMRLDRFVAARLRWRSRSRIRDLVSEGRISVEIHKDATGIAVQRTRPALRLRRGQEVVVSLDAAHVEQSEAREAGESPDTDMMAVTEGSADEELSSEIRVVWDDERILAVSKPPGVSLYPTRRHRRRSLLERVHRRHARNGDRGAPPSPCHRLDRETSGVVLFARDREARAFVGDQFETRRVNKTYLALTRGVPTPRKGSIDAPLGADPSSTVELRQAVRVDGRDALTDYETLEVLEMFDERGALVEVWPKTGRAHQIRAHLASIDCPILGDKLYLGGDEVFLRSLAGQLTSEDKALLGFARQALHAHRLELEHPVTRDSFEIVAPLWSDMRAFLEPANGLGSDAG